ncbi:MAG: hypothetical protein OEW93_01235, partial [Candidatus Bathyarchaeota archaeon]|nr:hypothetical protein [Candidatus Bathyarchaeota archaeon]
MTEGRKGITDLTGGLLSALLSKLGSGLRRILIQVVAIIFAFIAGAVVLYATGYSPLDAYSAMLRGAFGDIFGIGQTFTQATPITFTALAFLFAFKGGLFNI